MVRAFYGPGERTETAMERLVERAHGDVEWASKTARRMMANGFAGDEELTVRLLLERLDHHTSGFKPRPKPADPTLNGAREGLGLPPIGWGGRIVRRTKDGRVGVAIGDGFIGEFVTEGPLEALRSMGAILKMREQPPLTEEEAARFVELVGEVWARQRFGDGEAEVVKPRAPEPVGLVQHLEGLAGNPHGSDAYRLGYDDAIEAVREWLASNEQDEEGKA